MAASIQELLEKLAARAAERRVPPALRGVIRMDVEDAGRTEHWYLTIQKGGVTVGRQGNEPDCVLRGDEATFAAILAGEANMMAAVLRGAIEAEGKVMLLVVLQRFTPSEAVPVGVPAAGYARRQS
jgi:hypothetical protein